MLKAAGGAALAVARAKALAQDAVKSDGAGSVNQALVGYKLTLKELEAGISLGEKDPHSARSVLSIESYSSC